MSKVRVPIANTPAKVVTIESDATIGATFGVDLRYPDGTLVKASDFSAPPVNGGGGNQPAVTLWRLILEIPPNIVALAALNGDGYPYREDDGAWRLRKSGRSIVDFSFGDASPIQVYAPAEESMFVLARLVIDDAFDGVGAVLTLGDNTTADLYMGADENNPAAVAGYEVNPDIVLAAGAGVFLTITPGIGATTGAGRAIIETIPTAES